MTRPAPRSVRTRETGTRVGRQEITRGNRLMSHITPDGPAPGPNPVTKTPGDRKKRPRRHRLAKTIIILLAVGFFGWVLFQAGFVREGGAWVLGHLGPSAVPLLRSGLDDSDPKVVGACVDGLVRIGPEAVPPLVLSLEDENPRARAASARALGYMGAKAVDVSGAIPALADAMGDTDPGVRADAIRSLAYTGPTTKAFTTPRVVKALADPDPEVRKQAAEALWRTGANDPTVIAALAAALQDSDHRVRYEAAEALCKIGPPAKDAVPALTEALGDSDERVRKEAEEALGRITKAEPGGDKK